MTADPDHRRDPDRAERGEHLGHGGDHAPAEAARDAVPRAARLSPTSSILTISATTPWTRAVMASATTTRMIARESSGSLATSLSEMTMISAERDEVGPHGAGHDVPLVGDLPALVELVGMALGVM